MSVVSEETFLSLLAKTLSYFTNFDELNPTEEEKWVETVALLDYQGLNPFAKRKEGQTLPADKMLNLLRECLLAQRWEEVLKLITVISEHRKMNYTVFKVGLELCHHLEPCRGRYLEQLILHLLGPTTLLPRQVTLEYVLFLLSINLDSPDIEGAATVFQTFKKPALTKKRESEQMVLMFESYKGFIWYTLWKQSKNKVAQLQSQSETSFMEDVELSHEENKMKILCERAMLSLQMVRDQPGIWDIFITKYIDLLEWSGELDEIEPTLQSYQNNNPSYPNAHRYLLNYYREQENKEKMLPVLQKLCQLLPSDSVVLELVAHHRENGASPSVTMPLLFNLLDYPCWKDSAETWRLLAEDLISSLESETDASVAESLQCCWSSRYAWWLRYHFDKQSLRMFASTADSMETIVNKAAVAIIFGVATDYVDEVKQLLSDDKKWTSLLCQATTAARHLVIDR